MLIHIGKEKEVKRAEYLKVIDTHKMTSDERTVMLSTRDIGQKLTMRNQLKLLFHKYKAGLHLSEAELAVLFPQGRTAMPTDDDISEETSEENGDRDMMVLQESEQADIGSASNDGMSSLPDDEDPRVPTPFVQPGATGSVGAKMLEHIHQLKLAKGTNGDGRQSRKEERTEEEETLISLPKYVPRPVQIPIGIEGVTAPTDVTSTKTSTGMSGSVGNTHVKVDRDPLLQVQYDHHIEVERVTSLTRPLD